MKFYVGRDKKNGETLREVIKLEIKQKKSDGYISAATITNLIGKYPYADEKEGLVPSSLPYYGWKFDDVLKKMRLRQTKSGWFLYFPKTVELPFGDSFKGDVITAEEEPEATKPINDAVCPGFNVDGRLEIAPHLSVRCCRVISKKKNTKVTEYGYFHRWFHSRMPNSDGEMLEQELAIVEFKDGSIRQIRPDHIIFGWEE